jgi:hypothetical protein
MKTSRILTSIFVVFMISPTRVPGHVSEIRETNVQPVPEIKRLFVAFAGDWDTQEKREKTQFFPNGGERKGKTHIRLAAGGAMLVMEGHSDGSAGPLSYPIVIWWTPRRSYTTTSPASKTREAAAKCAARRIGKRMCL